MTMEEDSVSCIKRDWDLVENDLICILTWFEEKCRLGKKASVYRCSLDTGIPRSTLNDYIEAFNKWNGGEYDSWWLSRVGALHGFNVTYLVGHSQKLWVEKDKFEERWGITHDEQEIGEFEEEY